MARQRAATRKKRLTRGPRKGEVITVYVKSGTEVRTGKGGKKRRSLLVQGTGRNRSGNKRSGRKYLVGRNARGQRVHVYDDGTQVVVSKMKTRRYEDGSRGVPGKAGSRAIRKIAKAKRARKVRKTNYGR